MRVCVYVCMNMRRVHVRVCECACASASAHVFYNFADVFYNFYLSIDFSMYIACNILSVAQARTGISFIASNARNASNPVACT